MKWVLKWILVLVITLAILLLALSIALPLLLDPNNYKDEISETVLNRIGRELTIAGDISWRVFPSLGLEIDELSLANRAGFGTRPMLEIAEAGATVKLVPLLSRRLEIGRVDLEGVSAYLRSNTDGQNNWEDITGQDRGNTATNPGQEIAADLEVEISGGNLSLTSTSRRIDLTGFDDSTHSVDASQAFEMQGSLTLELLQQAVTGELECEGLLQAVMGTGLLGAQDVELSFTRTQDGGTTDSPVLQANANIIVDRVRDQAILEDLVLKFFDLRAGGSVNVTSLSNEPEYDGWLELSEFSPKQLLQDLGLEVPKTSKPDALGRMQADMVFTGSMGSMDIPELGMVLDGSTLEGQLTIEAFDPLQLAFDLNIDTLNLDDYSLVPENANASEDDVEVEGAGLFVGSMLLFTGSGDLNVGHLTSGGVKAEGVNITVTSNADEIRLFPMSSRFYGGQHQGDVRVSFSAGQPVLTANQVVSGFEVAGLLQDLSGSTRLRGTGDVYLKVRTELGSSQQIRQALTGDVGISVIDGTIDDVDIPGAVAKATALLGEKDVSGLAALATDRFSFSEFIVTGVITQGVFMSDDFILDSSLVSAIGKGTVNLVNETINYTIYPVLVNELRTRVPEDFRDVSIPVRITGRLSEPDLSADIAAGITASQNAKLANKADEVANALLQGLRAKKKDKEK